ncbi:unnamed protein product, partial [Mesorhabditis belari]|uniref:G patch domain-containing protein 11 n=1 Tax=Mesorhabditis belari TaxID=2138241 RepID=A0AAF3EEQ1_9BILA
MSYNEKRQKQIEKNRFEAEDRERELRKPKRVVEVERREEALSQPLDEETKGFQLLVKMGFKPGMSLGKKKDENDLGSGIREPIPLEVKTDRTGLGHGAAEQSQSRKRLQAVMDRMAKQARMADELSDEYRQKRRMETLCRIMVRAIVRARKTCAQLDSQCSLDVPIVDWFWPSYKRGNEDDAQALKRSQCTGYFYANKTPCPIVQQKSTDLTSTELLQRIRKLHSHLIAQYLYCVFCEKEFMEEEEMNIDCPGIEQHEQELMTKYQYNGIDEIQSIYKNCRDECFKKDSRNGISQPTIPWFWDATFNATLIGQLRKEELEAQMVRYVYTNGRDAPPEPRFDEFPLDDLKEKLAEIVVYLRDRHYYCLGCGTQAENAMALENVCDGDHDENDYAEG